LPKGTGPQRHDRRHERDEEDQRSSFQRDRDRILYSTALRRLAGITQVVSSSEGHVFHNRLTHTLEVAQLARRLAEMFLEESRGRAEGLGGLDPEVAEAAALAHDLGHPPFGHVAEEELDKLFQESQLTDGFEGNAQTFRVLTKLSVRYEELPGQNLTRATLNAVLKYPRYRTPKAEWLPRKFGAYQSERDDFEFARAMQVAGSEEEKCLEAEIMDWADDIAYAVHDMEDFYRAGLIPLERLMAEDERERQSFLDGTFRRWEQEEVRPIRPEHTDDELRTAFTRLIEALREIHPIHEPYSATRTQRARLRSLTSWLIRRYVRPEEDEPPIQLQEPTQENRRVVKVHPIAEREIAMLKQLTWFYIIHRPSLAGQQVGQRRIVCELFEIFSDAGRNPKKVMQLPVGAQERLSEELEQSGDRDGVAARIASDLICGLSEQQAIALYQRLTGVNPGSVLELIVP
jgi:dGTPase